MEQEGCQSRGHTPVQVGRGEESDATGFSWVPFLYCPASSIYNGSFALPGRSPISWAAPQSGPWAVYGAKGPGATLRVLVLIFQACGGNVTF